MSKNLRYTKNVVRKTGFGIKKKTSKFFDSFFHDDSKGTNEQKTSAEKDVKFERRAGVAGRIPKGIDIQPASSEIKTVKTAGRIGEAEPQAKNSGFKSGKVFGARKIPILVSVIAAAVFVPMIVVSANGSANNTVPFFAKQTSVTQQARQADGSLTANGLITANSGERYTEGAADLPNSTPEKATGQANAGAEADVAIDEQGAQQSVAEADIQETQAQPEPTPEPKQYLSLSPDQENPDVEKLQQRLMDLNYLEIDEPTQLYGVQTQLSVSYFQRKHGLDVDGVAGETTQDLLFSEDAKPYSVTLEAEGLDVANIQERLQELGYSVSATSYFGTETANAVQYFQRMNGLTDDGSVGQYTKEVLFSQGAEPSLEQTEEKDAKEEDSSDKSDKSDKSDGGDSGKGSGGGDAPAADPGNAQAFVNAATAQEGKTYVLGGKGPDVFDCSGLVYYALKQSGNGIGYMTSGGWANSSYTTISSISDLQVGDVICFTGHVGVYMGNGTMVDASSSKGQVVIRSLGSWAHRNFINGKRPLA